MKRLILAAALALAATPTLAAEFPVDVPEGATWTVDTVRTRTGQRDGKPTQSENRSRYQATYRSLKGGGGLLTLRLKDGGLPDADALQGVSLAAFDRPLVLEVDESLTPVRARNWPEYRAALFALFDGLMKDDPKADPKATQALKDMFSRIPDEQAHAIMAPAFNYIGLGQGLALELRKPFAYEGAQPNPMGGAPIKTRASYVLESLDRKEGRAVIVWKQALDPESLRTAVIELVRPLMAASPQAGNAEFEQMIGKVVLSRDDRCRFEIHVASGLAAKVDCAAEIKASLPGEAPFQRTDAWTITQSLPEVS